MGKFKNKIITRLKFIKLMWYVATGKAGNWVFFRMSDQEQLDFLNDSRDIQIDIRYMGVDKKVVEKIIKRIEK